MGVLAKILPRLEAIEERLTGLEESQPTDCPWSAEQVDAVVRNLRDIERRTREAHTCPPPPAAHCAFNNP
ncbi:hypothetical protein KBZ19_09840 [Synechococcus sp. L2F]|uniref:hypothetical protein n=1 Tax=Synechococcus sp. L2F TaxID=2823739 RepID=UPI0020CD9716|nr:hypothetical protein [Synechococcus sp. L2F]MCP9828786.1 hypothetical protein [Synechococcus sp. L2F]